MLGEDKTHPKPCQNNFEFPKFFCKLSLRVCVYLSISVLHISTHDNHRNFNYDKTTQFC
jgi:hypothetical protein